MAVIASVGRGGVGTTTAINTVGASLFVAFVANWTNQGVLSDNQGNTWTALSNTQWASNSGIGKLYYCQSPITNASHTFSFTNTDAGFAIIAFSEVGTFDTIQSVASNLTPPCGAGAITPATANSIIVAGFGCSHETMADMAIGGGFTLPTAAKVPGASGSNQGVGLAYLYQTGGAISVNPQWTGNATGGHVGCAIASFSTPVTATTKERTYLSVGLG